MSRTRTALVGIAATAAVAIASADLLAQDDVGKQRDAKVRGDKAKLADDERWIYGDLPRGIETARRTGKPLLVVFRCIPCEACAQIDADVLEGGGALAPLLEKFVCVRIPQMNGVDLSLFQFDFDQSWAAFFLNADLTIYGRYGTRTHRTESKDDVSLEGFAKSLEAVLDLHARFPEVKASLAAKRGSLEGFAPKGVTVPEEFPSLAGKYGSKLDYDGKVAKSCIHCHQVGEALRREARARGRAMPDDVLFPYPHPSVLGLTMDPRERARVASVADGSPAASAGLRADDDIVAFGGQPIVSTADLQWVLHRAGTAKSIATQIVREGEPLALDMALPDGWRARGDLSWRATTWDLCRMTTGGLRLEDLPADERRAAKLGDDALALRVKHVGQWGEHAAAKRAGFRVGDVIVALDGRTARLSETQWMTTLLARTKPGDVVAVRVRREGETVELKLPMQ